MGGGGEECGVSLAGEDGGSGTGGLPGCPGPWRRPLNCPPALRREPGSAAFLPRLAGTCPSFRGASRSPAQPPAPTRPAPPPPAQRWAWGSRGAGVGQGLALLSPHPPLCS